MLDWLAEVDWVGIGTAVGTLAVAVAAFWQLRAFNRSETRRAQPVVVAHHHGPRAVQRNRFGVYLTNEGIGTAFNVRFGVVVDGVTYPREQGTRHRIPPGGHVGTVAIDVPPEKSVEDDDLSVRVAFWATYEDAFGQGWETRNPADPRADFLIRPLGTRWKKRLPRWQTIGEGDRAVLPSVPPRTGKEVD